MRKKEKLWWKMASRRIPRTLHGSNFSVALKVLGVAAAVGSVWMSWGYRLHLQAMHNANAYERELARRVGWDESALHAFSARNTRGATELEDAAIFERIEKSGGGQR